MRILVFTHIDGSTILFLLFIVFGVPLIGIIIALYLSRRKPKTAKIIGILTVVYILISLGYCGILYI